MEILKMIIGQVPEAIFFALFMIFTKELKEKRVLFIILMVIEYLLLKQFLPFNIWFQITYTFTTYVILKLLYKDKSQIYDIFTFTLGSVLVVAIETVLYLIVWNTINNYYMFILLTRIAYVIFFMIFHSKLHYIQDLYKKLWNRNKQKTYKIKSTTFRSFNVVLFNVIFYVINIGIMFTIIQKGGV